MSEEKQDKNGKYLASIAWANTISWLGFWLLIIAGCCYTWDK